MDKLGFGFYLEFLYLQPRGFYKNGLIDICCVLSCVHFIYFFIFFINQKEEKQSIYTPDGDISSLVHIKFYFLANIITAKELKFQ